MTSGRDSDNEQKAVQAAGMRPPPPESWDADDERAAIWRQTVDACPPGWFPPQTHTLLEIYCSHVRDWRRYAAHAEAIYAQSKDGEGLETQMHGYYSAARERERKAVFDMATKMRLTQQSNYHPEKGRNKSKHGKLPHQQ